MTMENTQSTSSKDTLSAEAWQSLDVIQNAIATFGYSHFFTSSMYVIQKALKEASPDITNQYILRRKTEHGTIQFSLADEAIRSYRPVIELNTCFGAAVKVIGAYEVYVRNIVVAAEKLNIENLNTFITTHQSVQLRNKKGVLHYKNFIHPELGRGIDFFENVFGYKIANPSVRTWLLFLYELRNVAVHNLSCADERLCLLGASLPINPIIKNGELVEWNFEIVCQLNNLMLSIIPDIDKCVAPVLGLQQAERDAFWINKNEPQS